MPGVGEVGEASGLLVPGMRCPALAGDTGPPGELPDCRELSGRSGLRARFPTPESNRRGWVYDEGDQEPIIHPDDARLLWQEI